VTLRASFVLDPALKVAPVNRRTFGSFVEHMGRCVYYTGIYEPDHPTADEDGFRRDVLELTRELGGRRRALPGRQLRQQLPLGRRRRATVSSGLGGSTSPGAARRRTSSVSIEFMRWTAEAGVEPMIAMKLGTRGVQDALDLLEYANVPAARSCPSGASPMARLRPHGVRMWCLGNELDGPWQVGHKTAHEYGRLAIQTAARHATGLTRNRAGRLWQLELEHANFRLVGEREVLELAYDEVDYISCHAYYDPGEGESGLVPRLGRRHGPLCVHSRGDRRPGSATSCTTRSGSTSRSTNGMSGRSAGTRRAARAPGAGRFAPRIIEDQYTIADAVVRRQSPDLAACGTATGSTTACLAQLVNVIAPIRTEPGGGVVAADNLPSVRSYVQIRRGRRASHRSDDVELQDSQVRRRALCRRGRKRTMTAANRTGSFCGQPQRRPGWLSWRRTCAVGSVECAGRGAHAGGRRRPRHQHRGTSQSRDPPAA